MGFPDKKELERVRKKLKDVEGTLMISKDASSKEILRWNICQEFVKYSNDKQLKNVELAEILGVDKGDVSKILHHRIDRFTTDRLLDLLSIIRPNHTIDLKVS